MEDERWGSEMMDIQPMVVLGQQEGSYSVALDWVVERVMEFCHVVGLSCAGLEEKLLALFTDIKAT
jgi:hypothetical protein